ncbi:MAG: L-lactate permease, partial [Chloroflexota bacterium]
LVGMGVDPITAVTSVAVGHAWSVTFGDMGVVFQTLTALVRVDPLQLAGTVTTMLGIACLFCGLAAANIFKRLDRWPVVIVLAFIMGFVQYFLAVTKLPALAGFLAGLAGVFSGIVINRIWFTDKKVVRDVLKYSLPLRSALISYGSLALMMILINLVQPIHSVLAKTTWGVSFPSVTTLTGFFTPEKINQTYQPLLHPGTTILLIALLSYLLNRMLRLYTKTNLANIAAITLSSALPAIIGIFSMVGLSTLMDHSGMNILLANLLSSIFYNSFSIVSPFIGMLGAFATGSNNNSNVLFASLQEGIAAILKISPGIIVAAQTTGGSLGSMIAPAKIIVGLSTVDKKGQEGEVLRRTIPYGLGIGLAMGIITFIMVRVM